MTISPSHSFKNALVSFLKFKVILILLSINVIKNFNMKFF